MRLPGMRGSWFGRWLGLLACALTPRAEGQGAGCPPGGTGLRWETFALPLLTDSCGNCHEWMDYSEVYSVRDDILSLVLSENMPPFDPLPPSTQDLLAEWVACGLPLDGPSCEPPGTTLTFRGFAAGFFSANCGTCHSRALTGEARQGAPEGQDWDDYASVLRFLPAIRDTVLRNEMPPGGIAPSHDVDLLVEWIACGAPAVLFRRADPNDDGKQDLSDAVQVLNYLFSGTASVECLDAADVNASGVLDVSDAISLLAYLFSNGPPPPEPFSECGQLPDLGCESFESCPS